jgi:hypothetical protein
LSRPYILLREREREREREFVRGQLLIRSILVLLFKFEVPLKKLSKKVAAKKRTKKATIKKGICVCFPFFYAVVLCDYLCVHARVSTTV